MRLSVRVTPKGGRDAIEGWGGNADDRPFLKLRVSAPPADGAANAAVLALLAKSLGRRKSDVRLVSGETARLKLVEIEGLDEAALFALVGFPP